MNLTPLTNQQVFDNALNGIRAQKYVASRKTPNPKSVCAYLGDGGRKCGIGHSVPASVDAAKLDDLETSAIDAIMEMSADKSAEVEAMHTLFGKCDVELLIDLQSAHDNSLHDNSLGGNVDPKNTGSVFEAYMKRIASDYNLTYTPVPTA